LPLTPAVTAHAFDLLRGTLTYSDKASPAGFPESGGAILKADFLFLQFLVLRFGFWFFDFGFCYVNVVGQGNFIPGAGISLAAPRPKGSPPYLKLRQRYSSPAFACVMP